MQCWLLSRTESTLRKIESIYIFERDTCLPWADLTFRANMNKGRLTREAADYFTVDDLSFGQSTTTTAHFKIKNFMALFVFHEISVSDFKHLRAMGINLKTVIRPFFYFLCFSFLPVVVRLQQYLLHIQLVLLFSRTKSTQFLFLQSDSWPRRGRSRFSTLLAGFPE